MSISYEYYFRSTQIFLLGSDESLLDLTQQLGTILAWQTPDISKPLPLLQSMICETCLY